MVIRCVDSSVRFRVIALQTVLALTPGVPVHGEVCPNNWIFHRLFIPDSPKIHDAGGVRFRVHVHEGDVYYLLSRWSKPPGFAACNENEAPMTGVRDGFADLCHLTEKLDTFAEEHGGVPSGGGMFADGIAVAGRRRQMSALERRLASAQEEANANASALVAANEALAGNNISSFYDIPLLQGYVGLYGGTSCAHYTIESEFLEPNATCHTHTTGTCSTTKAH